MNNKEERFPRWVITGTKENCPVSVDPRLLLLPKEETNGTIVSGYLMSVAFQGYVTFVKNEQEMDEQISCWVDETNTVYEDIIPTQLLYPTKKLGEIIAGTYMKTINGEIQFIDLKKSTKVEISKSAIRDASPTNKVWIYKEFSEPCIEEFNVTTLSHVQEDNGEITEGVLTLPNGRTVSVELILESTLARRMAKPSWFLKETGTLLKEKISIRDLKNIQIDGDIEISGDYVKEGRVVRIEKKSSGINKLRIKSIEQSNTNNQGSVKQAAKASNISNKKRKLNDDGIFDVNMLEDSPNPTTVLVTASSVSTINLQTNEASLLDANKTSPNNINTPIENNTNNQDSVGEAVNALKISNGEDMLYIDMLNEAILDINLLEDSSNPTTALVTIPNVSTVNLQANEVSPLDANKTSPNNINTPILIVLELAEEFKRSFLEKASDDKTNQLVIKLINTVTDGMKFKSQEPTTNPNLFFEQPIPPKEFLNDVMRQCTSLNRVNDLSYLHEVDDILRKIINNQDFSEKMCDFITFQETVLKMIQDLPLDTDFQFDFQ